MVSLLLFASAGACAYLFLLNRVLIQLRDRRHKSFLIRVGGLLAVLLSGLSGVFAAGTAWWIAPAGVLAVTALGEVRRLIERRRCRGAAPIAQKGGSVRLSQPLTTTDLVVRHYAITAAGWRGPGLRIAHISDLHLNSHLPLSYYQDALRRAADERPDLVFFTGDFITYARYISLLPAVLPLVQGRLGTFGILGNHDCWSNPGAVAQAVRASGVTLLTNDGRRIPAGPGHAVVVAGYASPWSAEPWRPPEVAPGDLSLLLTHTPDNVYRLSRLGYTAIFAGHYHGGQIRLPGLGSLVVPSRYGRRFDHGHFVMNDSHLFITAGVGSAEPPVRIWCQPDIFIVDVHGA